MEAGIKIGLHNRFDIEVRDAITGELKNQATAYNIVLDALWTRLLARRAFMSAIHIGTGTGELSPARTSLFTFLAAKSVTLDSTSFNINNMYRRVKIQLEPAEYVGSIISEVGVAYSTSSGDLCTHAMLTDSEGNPITIEKTSTDVVIIYATVFFTVSNLPDYVKLTGVLSNNNVSNNQTLAYLINQSGDIESNIRVGTYGDNDAAMLFNNLRGIELATKSATITTDAVNKKLNFPVRRFEVTECNGPIQEFSIGGSFNIQLPNENYTGTNYTDVVLTGQDGTKKIWQMPSINVDVETIVVKVNGVVTEDLEIIPIPYYRTYRPSSKKANGIYFQNNSKFFYAEEASTPKIYGVEWDGTQWKQTINLTGVLPGTQYSFEMFYESPLAYAYKYDSGEARIFSKDNVQKAVYKRNTNLYVCGFLSDSVVLISPRASSSATSCNFVMGYTLDEGETWDWTDNLVGAFDSNIYNQLVVPARTKQIFFQGANASNAFRLYSYNLEDRTITLMSVPTATNRALGCFSMDESLLVAYGSSDGLDVFEEVEGVWTKTNIIPDTDSPATYDMAWFVDNYFIAGNTSTNVFSVWMLVDDVWTKVLVNVAQSVVFDMDIGAGISVSTLHTYNRKSPDGKHLMCDSTSNLAKYMPEGNYLIRFATAPLITDEIKVSYKVNGIHKTENYVLDVSGYIQFGE